MMDTNMPVSRGPPIGEEQAIEIADTFLNPTVKGGRHVTRFGMIEE